MSKKKLVRGQKAETIRQLAKDNPEMKHVEILKLASEKLGVVVAQSEVSAALGGNKSGGAAKSKASREEILEFVFVKSGGVKKAKLALEELKKSVGDVLDFANKFASIDAAIKAIEKLESEMSS